MTESFESGKAKRGIWRRAKFAGPMYCALLATIVAVTGMSLVSTSELALVDSITSITTATVMALLGLGGAIAGATGIHDSFETRRARSA